MTVRFCMPLAGGQRLKKIGFRDKFGIYRNLFKGNLDKRKVKYIISNKLLIFNLERRECLL